MESVVDIPRIRIQIVYGNGGIGDYIAWTPAIRYLAETQPHTSGYIVAPKSFYPLAKHWLGDLAPQFAVRTELRNDIAILRPDLGQPNANGFHMLDIGFMKYLNMPTPRSHDCYPAIYGNEVDVSRFGLEDKCYVVLTPGATAPNKEMPAETHNAIIDWAIERGLNPVVLGRRQVDIKYQAKFSDGIRYDKCIDLRDKTDLLEAACIMAKAHVVTGLDNGLTNLAACSTVPLVLALTISDIQIPRRRAGSVTRIIGQPMDLPCRYCSRNLRFTTKKDERTGKFTEAKTTSCFTGTLDCTKNVTPEKMIGALNGILKT